MDRPHVVDFQAHHVFRHARGPASTGFFLGHRRQRQWLRPTTVVFSTRFTPSPLGAVQGVLMCSTKPVSRRCCSSSPFSLGTTSLEGRWQGRNQTLSRLAQAYVGDTQQLFLVEAMASGEAAGLLPGEVELRHREALLLGCHRGSPGMTATGPALCAGLRAGLRRLDLRALVCRRVRRLGRPFEGAQRSVGRFLEAQLRLPQLC